MPDVQEQWPDNIIRPVLSAGHGVSEDEQLALHWVTSAPMGTLMKFMDASLVDQADLTILVRKLNEFPEDFEPESPAEPHTHDCGEVHFWLSEEPGTLVVEVLQGETWHTVTSPAASYTPPGVRHCFRFRSGPGYSIAVLRKGTYP